MVSGCLGRTGGVRRRRVVSYGDLRFSLLSFVMRRMVFLVIWTIMPVTWTIEGFLASTTLPHSLGESVEWKFTTYL